MSLMNFTSIDFETANKNRDSACSVAVVVIENVRKCTYFCRYME